MDELMWRLLNHIQLNETITDFGVVRRVIVDGEVVNFPNFLNNDDRSMTLHVAISTEGVRNNYNASKITYYTNDDIVSISIEESTGGNLSQVGQTTSATYSMDIRRASLPSSNPAGISTTELFRNYPNASIAMAIGIDGIYWPFGVWYVDDVTAVEDVGIVTLSGYDFLGSRYAQRITRYPRMVDGVETLPTWTNTREMIREMFPGIKRIQYNNNTEKFYEASLFEGVYFYYSPMFYAGTGSRTLVLDHDLTNEADPVIIEMMDSSYTDRDTISKVAAAMGCFAYINRFGALTFASFCRRSALDHSYGCEADPSIYTKFERTGQKFEFNRLQCAYIKDTGTLEYDVLDSAVDDSILPGSNNTMQIDRNPFINYSVATALYDAMSNSHIYNINEGSTLSFIGTPVVELGDSFYVASREQSYVFGFVVNSISTKYNGGFSMTVACEFDNQQSASDSTYENATDTLIHEAVTGGVAYTTSEVYTGRRWLDKKPIYRYIVTGSLTASQYNTTLTAGTLPLQEGEKIGAVVNIHGMIFAASNANFNWIPIPMAYSGDVQFQTAAAVRTSDHTIRLRLGSNSNLNVAKKYFIMIEYTKSTTEGDGM